MMKGFIHILFLARTWAQGLPIMSSNITSWLPSQFSWVTKLSTSMVMCSFMVRAHSSSAALITHTYPIQTFPLRGDPFVRIMKVVRTFFPLFFVENPENVLFSSEPEPSINHPLGPADASWPHRLPSQGLTRAMWPEWALWLNKGH